MSRQPLKAFVEEGAAADPLLPVDRSARPGTADLAGLNVVDTEPSDSATLADAPADPGSVLPEGVALLCVAQSSSTEHGRRLTMSWHYGPHTLEAHDQGLDWESDEGANRSIAQIMKAAQYPEDNPPLPPGVYGGPWDAAYHRATDCWDGVRDLGHWVGNLRETAADRAHLVIWDTSGEDIPWELYHGKVGVNRHGVAELGWLGVTIPVSRWVGDHPCPENYQASERHAAGGVLMFDDEQTHGKDENKYTMFHRGLEHVRVGDLENSMDNLLVRLESDEKFGLLMIRGHGRYGDTTESFTLAGLPLIRLNDLELEALGHNRPAVLLGLCSSGRTLRQKRVLNRPVRSFVDRFVGRGASSVIAILAEVDITHLSGMTARLIGDAQAEPIVIAEWLRQHRAMYFHKLKSKQGITKEQEEDWYRMFLTSCLFVCYCHPLATLHVHAADAGDALLADDEETC